MSKELIPLRKKQLQKQILEARSLGAIDQTLFLESQWVHRYGIETLEDSYAHELEPPTPISLDNIETEYQFEGSEISGQKSLFSEQPCLEVNLTVDNSNKIKSQNEIVESIEEKDLNLISDQEVEISKPADEPSPVIAPPPPSPALNHLRRWLPSIGDSIPKAS